MSISGPLPPELWMDRPGVPRLMAALDADRGTTRLVGGAVRDWLLNLTASDIDMATQFTPDVVIKRLEAAGIRAVPTGIRHGTVTAITHDHPYEVTTLRRDVETFGRHATVAFTGEWQTDAERRDFTMNALYADPFTGHIHDYFGGRQDLDARIVRFIGDPHVRIAEDHLRILRFFRFSARYGEGLEQEGLSACIARAADLQALSRERIRDELLKILALPDPAAIVAVMVGENILQPVLPEIHREALPRLAALIAAEARANVPPDPVRRLAALVPSTDAAAIGARLKMSNAERARLETAASATNVPADPRALAYRIGGEATLDLMLLSDDDRARSWARRLGNWSSPRMPISGKDLIAMGLTPGPDVSRTLRAVEDRWIAAGFPAQRDKVSVIARKIIGRR